MGHASWHAVELRKHPQLLAYRQNAISRLLAAADHSDTPANGYDMTCNIQAIDESLAARRCQERRQNLDEGRFTGAVAPQQAKDFALRNSQAQAIKGNDCFTSANPYSACAKLPAQIDGLNCRNFTCLCY